MSEVLRAMLDRAQMLRRSGRVSEAIQAYQEVLRRWPTLSQCWFNLAVLQRNSEQFHAALESYAQALKLGIQTPEEAHLNRSVIYTDYLRDDSAAERELLQALRLNEMYIPAMLNLANLYEDLGRAEESGAIYERIIAREPSHFEALARYANLHSVAAAGEELLNKLKNALVDLRASAAERASLGFALCRLLDGRGEFDSAFKAGADANNASRASAAPSVGAYQRARQEDLVDRLIEVSLELKQQKAPPELISCSLPQPIFICGMFRSGSTLAEQLLAAHPSITSGGELELLPRLVVQALAPFPDSMLTLLPRDLHAIAKQYLTRLTEMFPQAVRVTDKRPDNFLYIGLIKHLFPQSRIVHTTRDPLDNCLSIFFLHLDHRMSYALDLQDIGHYFREYRRLMQHWKLLYPADLFDFEYDKFVHHPEGHGRELFSFLGLNWEDRYLLRPTSGQSVKTASAWQVRQAIYTRSSGRARHYAKHLGALRSYLSDLKVDESG